MSERKIIIGTPEIDDKVWVAIHWQEGDYDRWFTSDRPLSREEIGKMEKKAKYSVDLWKYGIDFLETRVFITEMQFFDTKERMEEAEKKGFVWD